VLEDLVKFIDLETKKRVLFVDTAAEPFVEKCKEIPWVDKSKKVMEELGFELIDFSFTNKSAKEIEENLARVDIIYVAGGNAYYLLDKIYQVDGLEMIKKFVDNGGIYIGQSAGSYLAGPSVEPAFRPSRVKEMEVLSSFECLGLVDFTVLPHFGREDTRDNYLNHRCEYIFDKGYKIILLTDNQYIRVQKDGAYKIEEV